MATHDSTDSTELSQWIAASSADPSSWPTIWRVVAPRAGGYNRDMVFAETENESEARQEFRTLRRTGYPVRLERVQCGPLPIGCMPTLDKLRAACPQNPGQDQFPRIAGACLEKALGQRSPPAKHRRRA